MWQPQICTTNAALTTLYLAKSNESIINKFVEIKLFVLGTENKNNVILVTWTCISDAYTYPGSLEHTRNLS